MSILGIYLAASYCVECTDQRRGEVGVIRYLWGGLRHRLGRTVALLLGILVATASFTVLTGTSRTTQLRTVGTVAHNYRSAYDILVRPKGSTSALERSRGLVRPNYLSGIFGGISLKQYATISKLAGVQVAAPIAMIGYIVPTVAITTRVPDLLTGVQQQLYRVDRSWVFDRGLSTAPDASAYVYETHNKLSTPPILGAYTTERVDGRTVRVCKNIGLEHVGGPFELAERTSLGCYDSTAPAPSVVTLWSFPVLIAAIDPAAEAKLAGVNQAVVSGRYLRPSDALAPVARGSGTSFALPVLSPTNTYDDEQLKLTTQLLPAAAANSVLTQPLTQTNAAGRFGTLSGAVTGRTTVSSAVAYRQLLASTHSPTTSNNGFVNAIYTPGSVGYQTLADGTLRPETVTNPPSIWTCTKCQNGYNPAPLPSADTQFRQVTVHRFTDKTGLLGQPILHSVGEFDPAKLPGFSALSQVPLETYAPPTIAPGDAAATKALGGKDLLPSSNLGGYAQQPPLMLTTLDALAGLAKYYPGAVSNKPISVIRVRVAGVTGIDPLSRARVQAVAAAITKQTGLDVDITVGSSPAPQTVQLPAGKFGRPELVLREGWSKEGVAVAIVDAVDHASVLLFGLILAVCALFVANAASAAVRARHTELGVLACLGWDTRKLFAAVLTEVGLIGLAAGCLGTVLALPLSAAFGLSVSLTRAGLAVPAALALALLAGLVPAARASRADPAAAVRPPVLAVRGSRTPRNLSGLAARNLLRSPGRSLLAALSLAIGICALTLLLAFSLAFRGQIVGTLLGNAIAGQTRSVDYVAAAVTVLLGAFAIADVLYLNIRERSTELATLAAVGWRDATLTCLVTLEGAGMGLAGSVLGAGAGLGAAAVFTGSLPARLVAVAVAGAVIGTLIAIVAAVVPARLRGRLVTVQALAEE